MDESCDCDAHPSCLFRTRNEWATQPPTIVPEAQTTLSEPFVIELVSDPPPEEVGETATKEEAA
jgi:hypothetical protein